MHWFESVWAQPLHSIHTGCNSMLIEFCIGLCYSCISIALHEYLSSCGRRLMQVHQMVCTPPWAYAPLAAWTWLFLSHAVTICHDLTSYVSIELFFLFECKSESFSRSCWTCSTQQQGPMYHYVIYPCNNRYEQCLSTQARHRHRSVFDWLYNMFLTCFSYVSKKQYATVQYSGTFIQRMTSPE